MARCFGIPLLLASLLCCPRVAAAGDWDSCRAADPTLVIPACTRIIETGKEQDSNIAIALYNRGSAYFKQGDGDLALQDFDRSIALDSEAADTYFNRGLLLIRRGAYERAYSDLDTVMRLAPDTPKAHFYRGFAAHGRGDAAAAVKDYDSYLKLVPDDAEAYFNRGVARSDLKDDAGALADYDKALSLNRSYADAYVNRGNLYRRNHSLDQAIADFTSAMDLDLRIPEPYANRAGAYADRGDNEKEAADLESLLKLNPPKQLADFAHETLARLKPWAAPTNQSGAVAATPSAQLAKPAERNDCDSADPPTAVTGCTQLIDANASAEKVAKAHHNRGLAYFNLGKAWSAIDDFTKAIALSPGFALPYYGRGNAYYQLDQYEKALRDYNKYVALAPQDLKGYAGRALTLQELDRAKEAMADFERAIVLNPRYSLAHFGRGQIRTDERKYNLAIDDFDTALALNPKYAVALRYRGYAQKMRGDRAKAALDYERTLTLNPSRLTEQRAYEGLARIKKARPRADAKAAADCNSGTVDGIFRGCSDIAEDEEATPGVRAQALMVRGQLYARLSETQRSIEDFTAAIEADGPHVPGAFGDRGAAYARANQLDLAIKDYDQAIRLFPGSAGYRANRGLAYERSGRRAEALSDFQQALTLSPTAEIAALASGGIKRLGATAPPSAEKPSFFNEAELCSGTDPDLAISGCTLVIGNTAYPAKDRALALANRGTAWSRKGNLAEAIKDYTRAIELEPGFALAYANRGAMYAGQKDDVRALAEFQKAIELDSKYAYAYASRGEIFERRGDRDAANADYERALSLNPSPVASSIATEGRQRLIDTATRAGDAEVADCGSSDVAKAISGCTRIIEVKTHSAQMRSVALMQRGAHYMGANDLPHASADFDAILALNPAHAMALGLRGYIHFAKGEYDSAVADLKRSVEIGTYAEAHRYLAIALEGKGDHQAALGELETALSSAPKDAELLFHRGAVREKLGETAAAKQDYEAALASAPPEHVRAPAQAALDRLTQKR